MEDPKTAEILEPYGEEPDQDTPTPTAPAIPKRGQRIVKLALKNGKIAECHIKPLVVFIKQQMQREIRRQMLIEAKLKGIEEQRKALDAEVTKAFAEKRENADSLYQDLEKLYDAVVEDEKKLRKANCDIAFIVTAIPPIPDGQGNTRAAKFDDVDWDNCEIGELEQAQFFFLTP